jgi:hypothetical protein
MAKGTRRFDRRMRPGEDTEVIPAAKDDATDDETTGEIPIHHDDVDDPDADLDSEHADPLPSFGDYVRQTATRLGQRLIQLSAALLVWLGGEVRTRLPQFAHALRPRLIRLGATMSPVCCCARVIPGSTGGGPRSSRSPLWPGY